MVDEIILSTFDTAGIKKIRQLLIEKKIRRIGPRVYTSNFIDSPEVIIRRNIFRILNQLYPEAVLSYRSAFEIKPTITNQLFLTYKYARKIIFPGLTIKFIKGCSSLADDIRIGPLCASSRHRAFLENLRISRKKGGESKILQPEKLKAKLIAELKLYGEDGLNQMLFNAKNAAGELNMEKEYIALCSMVHQLLSEIKEQPE